MQAAITEPNHPGVGGGTAPAAPQAQVHDRLIWRQRACCNEVGVDDNGDFGTDCEVCRVAAANGAVAEPGSSVAPRRQRWLAVAGRRKGALGAVREGEVYSYDTGLHEPEVYCFVQ